MAWLIDAIVPIVLVLFGYLLGGPTDEVTQRTAGSTTIEVTTSTGYQGLFFAFVALGLGFDLWNRGFREGTKGSSIGKAATGFATVKEQTNRHLGPAIGILRAALLWVDFAICYVGVLWPLWDAKSQTLISDRTTGAVVIRKH